VWPNGEESKVTGKAIDTEIGGTIVRIRPICPADRHIEADFVRRLSPGARHYRFLGGVHELSDEQLEAFCSVDGEQTMAFIATVQEDGEEVEVGVSRYAPGATEDHREFAITVADDWQDRGLGAELARRLIAHARDHGVKRLHSVELADNAFMRALAAELGMSTNRDPNDVHQVIYSLSIQ